MNTVDAAQLADRIEESLRLSDKAANDPETAQALTELLKNLQTYQVRTSIHLSRISGLDRVALPMNESTIRPG